MIVFWCSPPTQCCARVVVCAVLEMAGAMRIGERGSGKFTLRCSKIEFYYELCQHFCSHCSCLDKTKQILLQSWPASTSPPYEKKKNLRTRSNSIDSCYMNVSFFFQVRTRKIHIFTIIQLLALAFILGIKLSSLAPSFPFFIICLIPLRKLLTKFYTEHEMEEVCWLWFV